jgi:outer membrane receptor protein involved in Fe transport
MTSQPSGASSLFSSLVFSRTPQLADSLRAPSVGERRTTMSVSLFLSTRTGNRVFGKAGGSGFLRALFLAIAITALPCFHAPARAQSGSSHNGAATVRDGTRGAIAGASVRILGAGGLLSRQTTNAAGQLDLSTLPAGTYVIEISAEGFQTFSQRFTLPAAGTLEWTLEVAGTHQTVNVLGAGLPEIPDETAKSVTVIPAEELRARDIVTLSDALRSVPGLQLQQLGAPAGIASYRFRGLRPEDSALQLDGFRLADPSDNKGSARPLLTEMAITSADRLEILRGAASSLYGTNAVGGVINAQTRYPAAPRSGYLAMEGGSLGLLLPSAGISGQAELSASRRLAYSLNLTHQNYLSGPDGQDATRNTTGSAAAWFTLAPAARLFTRFTLSDGFGYLNESPAPTPNLPDPPRGAIVRDARAYPDAQANFYPQINDPDNHQRIRFYSGAARLEFAPVEFWQQSLGFQSLRARRRYTDGPDLAPLARTLGLVDPLTPSLGRYDSSAEQLVWQNSLRASSVDRFHAGLEYNRVSIDQLEFGQTTVARQNSLSVSARNHASLFDGRVQAQLGGQIEFYSLSAPEFFATGNVSNPSPYTGVGELSAPRAYTADASLAWFLRRSGTKLRAHAGNGFRSPSLYERYGSGGRSSYYGDPLLKPERTNFIDAGLDQKLWGDRVEASATWFYSRLHTIIDFGGTPADRFGRFFGYVNTRGGNARGAELSVRARPARALSFNAGYTYTNSDLPFATAAGTTRVLGVADHQFNAGVLVEPTRRLSAHLQVYAVSNHDFPLFGSTFPFPFGVFRFPGYARLDLTLGAELLRRERHSLRWSLRVDNLLDQQYFSAGFREPGAVARTGLRWEF